MRKEEQDLQSAIDRLNRHIDLSWRELVVVKKTLTLAEKV
jgi:hypothetical protein